MKRSLRLPLLLTAGLLTLFPLATWAAPSALTVPTAGVERRVIGTSRQQRPIEVVSIGSPDATSSILIVFGQHGDERDGIQTGQYLLRDLQTALSQPHWQHLLATTRLDIVLLLNPDGAAHPTGLGQRENSASVDLNRNWGYHWEAPSLSTHRGPNAFSEPEIQALRDYLLAHREIKLVVDYHTGMAMFSQGMVHYPYTYTEQNILSPEEQEPLLALAQQTAQRLTLPADLRSPVVALPVHAVKSFVEKGIRTQVPIAYQPQALASLPASFPAPGSLIDWVYGELGIPALGVELSRPFQAEQRPAFMTAFEAFYPQLAPRLLETISYWLTVCIPPRAPATDCPSLTNNPPTEE